jgi:hypothetical protein
MHITSSWIREARILKYLQAKTCLYRVDFRVEVNTTHKQYNRPLVEMQSNSDFVNGNSAVPKRCPLGCVFKMTIQGPSVDSLPSAAPAAFQRPARSAKEYCNAVLLG